MMIITSDTIVSRAKTLNKFREHDVFSESGFEGILLYIYHNYDWEQIVPALRFFHMLHGKFTAAFKLYSYQFDTMYDGIMKELRRDQPVELTEFLYRSFITDAKLNFDTDVPKTVGTRRVNHLSKKTTTGAVLLDNLVNPIAGKVETSYWKALLETLDHKYDNKKLTKSGDHILCYQKHKDYESRGLAGNIYFMDFDFNCKDLKEASFQEKVCSGGLLEKGIEDGKLNKATLYKVVTLGMDNKLVAVPNKGIAEICEKYFPTQMYKTAKEWDKGVRMPSEDNIFMKLHTEIFRYILDEDNDGERLINALETNVADIEEI